jgi:hypothetical protein
MKRGIDGQKRLHTGTNHQDDAVAICTLKHAGILISKWRKEYNSIRPYASLGYRPPASEAELI